VRGARPHLSRDGGGIVAVAVANVLALSDRVAIANADADALSLPDGVSDAGRDAALDAGRDADACSDSRPGSGFQAEGWNEGKVTRSVSCAAPA
jgi:hypothetical protein